MNTQFNLQTSLFRMQQASSFLNCEIKSFEKEATKNNKLSRKNLPHTTNYKENIQKITMNNVNNEILQIFAKNYCKTKCPICNGHTYAHKKSIYRHLKIKHNYLFC